MHLFSKLAAASAAAVALAASAASAAIVTATYSGTVVGTGNSQTLLDGAFDYTGEFGGNPIDGSSFKAVFKFDTSLALFDPAQPGQLFGGSIFGTSDPIVSAVLTINGVDQTFAGATQTIAFLLGNGTDSTSLHLADAFVTLPDGSSGERALVGQFFNPNLPMDLRAAYSGGRVVIDFTQEEFGEFIINEQDASANTTHLAYGYLAADHLTVSSTSVPEPASWALMLLGLGGLGAALRAARGRAATA